MKIEQRLPLALLFLRIGVFIVMLMWTLDKFVHPEHSAKIFGKYYSLSGLEPTTFTAIGVVELVIILAFLLGVMKQWSYGAVFLLHAVSTFGTFGNYLNPWPNLLYFSAWPILAACFTLYYLRDADTLLTFDKAPAAEPAGT